MKKYLLLAIALLTTVMINADSAEVPCGKTVTVEANGINGYHFVEWQNSTNNATVSTLNPYSYVVDKDAILNLTAIFAKDFALNIEVWVTDENNNTTQITGDCSGYVTINKDKDEYQPNDVAIVAITIADCYNFVKWTDNGGQQILGHDGNANLNGIKVEMTGDTTIRLYLEIRKYQVNVSSDPTKGTATITIL